MPKHLQPNFKLKSLIAIFLTPILSLGLLIGPVRADVAADNVVISEILFNAQGSDAGKEFIELYNPTADGVSLVGWSLKYTIDDLLEMKSLVTFNSNEGDVFSKNSFLLIGFNGYLASNYNNVLADVARGASLPNGEKDGKAQKITIILLDKQDNEIDRMSYNKDSIVEDGQSLERKAYQNNICVSAQNLGENLGNGCDTGSLDDFEIRPVPNPQNALSLAEPATGNSLVFDLTPTPTPTPSPSPSSAAIAPLVQKSLPVAEAGQDKEAVIGENIDFDGSDSFDPSGKDLIFSWDFGDKTNAKGINVSHIYNTIGEYSVILKVNNGENISEDSLKLKIIAPEFSDKIILSEILPNPPGADKDGEWIELFNSGDKRVNLLGWILSSSAKTSGKQYVFFGDRFVEPKKFLAIKRSESGLVLANEGGKVSLVWPAEKILSEVSYGSAKEGKSYAFINNSWQWSDTPTPGKENSAKTLAAVSEEKENFVTFAGISKNTNGLESVDSEGEAIGDSAVNSLLAKSTASQLEKSFSIEDFLNKLISEKVNNAISKAKADETDLPKKISLLADNTGGNGIADIDQESVCKDFCAESERNALDSQKDIRNNPWFYGDIALSILSLFLVWRYQEARKKLKQS